MGEGVDMYAFGVVVWEMVSGGVPWGELDHPMQIIFAVGVQGARLPLPPRTPTALAELVGSCWAEDPAARPPFAVIAQRLREMAQGEM